MSDLSNLIRIANRTVRADFYDFDALASEYAEVSGAYLSTIYRRDLVTNDTRRHVSDRASRVENSPFWNAIEVMGERLDYVIENQERKAKEAEIATWSREEWGVLEREYVRSLPISRRDPGEGEVVCKAWDCVNIYKYKLKGSVYCCEQCRRNEKSAQLRLRQNGTLLPVKEYKAYRAAYLRKKTQIIEVPLSLAQALAMDGRDYRPKLRRKRTLNEVVRVDMMRVAEELRNPGEINSYNLAEVTYSIDERGRYLIGGEWERAFSVASSWNNFI